MQQRHISIANDIHIPTSIKFGGDQQSYGRFAATLGGALLTIYGLTRGSAQGWGMAAAGGVILYRALNGTWSVPSAATALLPEQDIHVTKTIAINKSPDEVYRFWRDFTNLPRFMKHLVSVEVLDDTRSRWTATGPANSEVTWEATITDDQPDKLISWQSLEQADVTNNGTVRFETAPNDRGTIVHVELNYAPPAGIVGATVAWLFGEEPGQQIEGDLRRFRSLMEAGEVPTTSGQPSGSRSLMGQLIQSTPTKTQKTL